MKIIAATKTTYATIILEPADYEAIKAIKPERFFPPRAAPNARPVAGVIRD